MCEMGFPKDETMSDAVRASTCKPHRRPASELRKAAPRNWGHETHGAGAQVNNVQLCAYTGAQPFAVRAALQHACTACMSTRCGGRIESQQRWGRAERSRLVGSQLVTDVKDQYPTGRGNKKGWHNPLGTDIVHVYTPAYGQRCGS